MSYIKSARRIPLNLLPNRLSEKYSDQLLRKKKGSVGNMAAATEQGGAEGVKMKTDVRNNPATGPDHYQKRANAP